MLSPFQFYFLESALAPTQHVEVIRWERVDCNPAKVPMSLHHVLCGAQGNIC